MSKPQVLVDCFKHFFPAVKCTVKPFRSLVGNWFFCFNWHNSLREIHLCQDSKLKLLVCQNLYLAVRIANSINLYFLCPMFETTEISSFSFNSPSLKIAHFCFSISTLDAFHIANPSSMQDHGLLPGSTRVRTRKSLNITITGADLNSLIVNMNSGSLHTKSKTYTDNQNSFKGPKSFRGFRETGPTPWRSSLRSPSLSQVFFFVPRTWQQKWHLPHFDDTTSVI